MIERGAELFQIADRQLSGLIGLLSTRDEAAVSLPCPGREKLAEAALA